MILPIDFLHMLIAHTHTTHTHLSAVQHHESECLIHGPLEGSLDGHDGLLVSETTERGVLNLQ